MEEQKMCRFIDSNYKDLFSVPDGESVEITYPSGNRNIVKCKYLDPTHTSINGTCYHIRQIAEILERQDAIAKPYTLQQRATEKGR